MTIGKISASPMAFHPRRPPRRNDTSAKPSRSTRRATTEATAGDHIRAQIHDELPVLMMIAWKTAVSGTRTAKYMARPRRARSRVSPSAASDAGDVLMLKLKPLSTAAVVAIGPGDRPPSVVLPSAEALRRPLDAGRAVRRSEPTPR